MLRLQTGIVNAVAGDTGHSAGFHAAHAKALGLEPLGQNS